MLVRLTGESDVEDLAQEVFLRLFRGLRGFRQEARVTTFLYRIVVNVVNDEWRRREQARRSISIDEDQSGWKDRLAGNAPDPGELLDRERFLSALGQCLSLLNERERAAVALYFQEQRTYGEIAQILDVPVGTVKTHLHRARSKLKQALRERIARCGMAH